MYSLCPNRLTICPYFTKNPRDKLWKQFKETSGCHADTDHTTPQSLGRLPTATALEKAYIYSESNLRQLCRWEHDQKEEPGFPSIEAMCVALTVKFEAIAPPEPVQALL